MDIPRELFYEERRYLKQFGIDNGSSNNKALFEKWILTLTDLRPGESGYTSRILQAFNDAYFICTLILRFPENILSCIPYIISRTTMPSVVIPMVYYYLENLKKKDGRITLLLKALDTEAKRMGWKQNLDDINKIFDKKKAKGIDSTVFSCRVLSPSVLSTIDWQKVTKTYKKELVESVIRVVAKNEDEAKMMAEAIKEAANKTEDEFYNPEPYIESDEYPDEPDEPNEWSNWTPDYSETYNLCADIIEGDGYSKIKKQTNNEKYDFPNKIAVTRSLQSLFEGKWFDECSSDIQTYTKQWRERFIDDLLKSEWGPRIGEDWKMKRGDKIKYGLVGLLNEYGVIKGKKGEIVAKLPRTDKPEATISDYMGSKGKKYYAEWLHNYLTATPEMEKSD